MSKYSLWIVDGDLNSFIVPLKRENQECKKKVELYEIDLLTVSLGKVNFVKMLKKSNIAPSNFDWKTAIGYIQYHVKQKQCYLPLIFQKDRLLLDMLNFQNQYRYHKQMNETKIKGQILSQQNLSMEFQSLLAQLGTYVDQLLVFSQHNNEIWNYEKIPQRIRNKIYSYINSITPDECTEYRSDIIRELISYINFRKIKTFELGGTIDEKLFEVIENVDIEEYSDKEEFLTEEEKKQMNGYEDGMSYQKRY